jgi:hypothetical protein
MTRDQMRRLMGKRVTVEGVLHRFTTWRGRDVKAKTWKRIPKPLTGTVVGFTRKQNGETRYPNHTAPEWTCLSTVLVCLIRPQPMSKEVPVSMIDLEKALALEARRMDNDEQGED